MKTYNYSDRHYKRTISQLVAVRRTGNKQPTVWRVIEEFDGTYQLEFCYEKEPKNFHAVAKIDRKNPNKPGPIKAYKSMNAVFSDIRKVTRNCMLNYIGPVDEKTEEK